MNVPLPISQHEQIPTVCRMLRTKTALGSYVGDDYAPWQTAQSTSAAYWCIRTMTSAGPDDCFAHPDYCRESRSCFEQEE